MKGGMINLIFLCINMLFVTNCYALNVQIFTDAKHPVDTKSSVAGPHIEYYNLNQMDLIISKLNSQIREESVGQAKRKIKKLMQAYRTEIQHAVEGNKLSQKYKIHNVPAIVFDEGKYTIYGQTSFQASLEEYKSWLKSKK